MHGSLGQGFEEPAFQSPECLRPVENTVCWPVCKSSHSIWAAFTVIYGRIHGRRGDDEEERCRIDRIERGKSSLLQGAGRPDRPYLMKINGKRWRKTARKIKTSLERSKPFSGVIPSGDRWESKIAVWFPSTCHLLKCFNCFCICFRILRKAGKLCNSFSSSSQSKLKLAMAVSWKEHAAVPLSFTAADQFELCNSLREKLFVGLNKRIPGLNRESLGLTWN